MPSVRPSKVYVVVSPWQSLPAQSSVSKPTRHHLRQSPVAVHTLPGAQPNESVAQEPAVVPLPARSQMVVLPSRNPHPCVPHLARVFIGLQPTAKHTW